MSGAALGTALALAVALQPSMEGLGKEAQLALAVVAFTLVFLIFEVLPWAATMVVAMALFMLVGSGRS